VGTGALPQPAEDALGAVVQLVRACERGEQPALKQLLACLGHVRGLDLSAAGGDALLWAVPPVLQAARAELLREDDERRVLEVEMVGLRLRDEQAGLDAEDHMACLARARDRLAGRIQHRAALAAELEASGARLQADLSEAEGEWAKLARRAREGLQDERDAWAREREGLLSELSGLNAQAAELADDTELQERAARAKERLAAAQQKIEVLMPSATRCNELREKMQLRESQIEDLLQQLASHDAQAEARRSRPKARARSAKAKRAP